LNRGGDKEVDKKKSLKKMQEMKKILKKMAEKKKKFEFFDFLLVSISSSILILQKFEYILCRSL